MTNYKELQKYEAVENIYGRVVKNTLRKGYCYIRLLHCGEYLRTVYREDKCSVIGECSIPIVLGTLVRVNGLVEQRKDAPNGFEIQLTKLEILYTPDTPLSYPVGDGDTKLPLEDELRNRDGSLMHPDNVGIFKICSDVMWKFRNLMHKQGYTEVRTPVIIDELTKDKKRKFEVKYFGQMAYLSQDNSPQLISAAKAFGGAYEINTRFNAVAHGSPIYLNEFTAMSFATENCSVEMAVELAVNSLRKFTKVRKANVIGIKDAFAMLGKDAKQKTLDPTDEVRLFKLLGKDLYFVDESPRHCVAHLPFDKGRLASRDSKLSVYYKGIKIGKIEENFEGVAAGVICVERFVYVLMGLSDVRKASLFPRDLHTFE